MKILVIGHPEAVQGFALVGVHGIVAASAEAVHDALDRALALGDVGIILITDDAAKLASQRVALLKRRSEIPILLEIPGPDGMDPDRASLSEVVQRAIGIHL
jgi:vacuolar-type H+-ATPase subunit F/Vma7